MTGAATTVAVLAAMGAAAAFGLGVALQHHQARQQDTGAPLRLLSRLVRNRRWLAGVGLAVAAYGLQGLALAFGPLALVAPLVATDLLFALPAAAFWERKSMRRSEWAGCGLVATGVGVFVASSPPPAGQSAAPAADWLAAFGVVGFLASAAVLAALLGSAAYRAALLALAAGIVFGLTAAVTLSFSRLLRATGVSSILAHWQPWVLLVLGVAGVLLSVSAYQAGALRTSLPIMDTVEPVSGVLIGTAVFAERLASSPGGLALQLCGAAAAVAGIVVLGRSPLAATARPGPSPASRAVGGVPHQRSQLTEDRAGGRPAESPDLAANGGSAGTLPDSERRPMRDGTGLADRSRVDLPGGLLLLRDDHQLRHRHRQAPPAHGHHEFRLPDHGPVFRAAGPVVLPALGALAFGIVFQFFAIAPMRGFATSWPANAWLVRRGIKVPM